MEKDNSDQNKFFAPIRELMLEFVEKGEGKVAVDIMSYPIGNGRSELKVSGPNLFHRLNSIPSENLRDYLSKLQHPSKNSEAFEIFQKSLLDVLDESGFGQVKLNFEKNKRQETIVFCEVTISHKHVLQSV